jgi:hypothetical protein
LVTCELDEKGITTKKAVKRTRNKKQFFIIFF